MTEALAGRTVLVTRPVPQAAALAQAIEEAGGAAFVFPALAIEALPADALATSLTQLRDADIAIFISPNAAQFGMAAIRTHGGLPDALRVFAVGPGTARAPRWNASPRSRAFTSSESLRALARSSSIMACGLAGTAPHLALMTASSLVMSMPQIL